MAVKKLSKELPDIVRELYDLPISQEQSGTSNLLISLKINTGLGYHAARLNYSLARLNHLSRRLEKARNRSNPNNEEICSKIEEIFHNMEPHAKSYISAVRISLDLFLRDLYSEGQHFHNDESDRIDEMHSFAGRPYYFDDKGRILEMHGREVVMEQYAPRPLMRLIQGRLPDAGGNQMITYLLGRVANIKNLLAILEKTTDPGLHEKVIDKTAIAEFTIKTMIESVGYISEERSGLTQEYGMFVRFTDIKENSGVSLLRA